MGLISRLYNFVAGTVIDSEQVDAEFDQLVALVNGNLDAANIKDLSVGTAELVDGAVTLAKLADPTAWTPGAWTNLTLQNGWFNPGGVTPGYRKEAYGRVWLRGKVAVQPNASTVFATLPVGFRPPAQVVLPTRWWDGTIFGSGAVIVNTDGTMLPDSGVNAFGHLLLGGLSIYTS